MKKDGCLMETVKSADGRSIAKKIAHHESGI